MIAVDTSALMAILLDEPEADACIAALATDEPVVISAATVAEALVVSERRNVGVDMARLIDEFDFEIVGVTAAAAWGVALAYRRWGKGLHPAALNFGDCFAYEIAQANGCRLLYIGHDFAQTDVGSVLSGEP